jgi:enamine deaminase RidA (YjgF/YER057c/UK114 family)
MHVPVNQSRAVTFPGMSQAVVAGEIVVVSGQVALDDSGQIVGIGDAATQAEQCFLNIERLLDLSGAALSDVVKLTCFLADRAAYAGYLQAKLRRYPDAGPAGTAVIVAGLLDERFLMEVEAIAVIDRRAN